MLGLNEDILIREEFEILKGNLCFLMQLFSAGREGSTTVMHDEISEGVCRREPVLIRERYAVGGK